MKQTIAELSEHFNSRMAEFQKNLQASAATPTSPPSNIAAQFGAFRSFVLAALEGLQLQLDILTRKQDEMEMRSRKKILLIHGIQENKNEKISSVVSKVLSEHINIPGINEDSICRCHRLGYSNSEKTRAVLVKFHDLSLKNKIWYAKSRLKNTGITLSEFLTKDRHNMFVAARQRYGISKCWTKDGNVMVTAPDGSIKCIHTMAELNALTSSSADINYSSNTATASSNPNAVAKDNKVNNIRSKRIIKK